MPVYWEARIGSIIAGGGIILAAKLMTENFTSFRDVGFPPGGPLEICALGIVIWLHAKYRGATHRNR